MGSTDKRLRFLAVPPCPIYGMMPEPRLHVSRKKRKPINSMLGIAQP